MNAAHAVPFLSREIGPGRRTYIIAEAGVNHDGDLTRAMRLIEAAKLAGADAVKFQFFSASRLAAVDAPSCSYQNSVDGDGQQQMLRSLELPPEAFVALHRRARETEIDFLVTPFGREELRYLVEEVGVQALKIASPDLVNVPLMDEAAATGLPMIVSTGASQPEEIDAAWKRLRREGAADRTILLHCVSAYPTPPTRARLDRIRWLGTRFGVPAGFSDHTAGDETSFAAVLAGACVLEKHLTIDRTAAGPDHFFSLEPSGFSRYVDGARRAEAMLGRGEIGWQPEEEEVRALARGRIIAARVIRKGERLTAENLSVQRPGDGISPLEWDSIIGRCARINIEAGTPLAADMMTSTPLAGCKPGQS